MNNHTRNVISLSLWLVLGLPVTAAYGEPPDRIATAAQDESDVTSVLVPLCDGRVAWNDAMRALARAKGFDDEALADLWPRGSVDLTGRRGQALLAGLNLVLAPSVRFRLASQPETGDQQYLEISLDRAAMLASKRRFKQMLRRDFLGIFSRPQRLYGLELDDGWQTAPLDKPLVVLIHGLQSSTGQVGGILGEIRGLGLPCGTFDYPNDQPIEQSARLLARQLAEVAQQQPARKVALLTHSMGGLVAREAIENPQLDPGNVGRLIMVSCPNQGSMLAHFAFALEIWEHIAHPPEQKSARRLYALVEDGLGEAADDLRPGSPFLKNLNARPRNADVRYTIFLGTAAPLDETALDGLRHSLKTAADNSRFVRFFGPRLDDYLADLDEVVRGKGDGVVAVKRGQLDEVDDIVVMEFGHQTLTEDGTSPAAGELRRAILQRLRDD